MKIEINLDNLNSIPEELSEIAQLEKVGNQIYNHVRNVSNSSILISGYRGVGKTSLIQMIENKINKEAKKENGDKITFVYQNIDKYDDYSILLRKLIRGVCLSIIDNKNLVKKNDELFLEVESLYEHTFFDVNRFEMLSNERTTEKNLNTSINFKTIIMRLTPLLLFIGSFTILKAEYISAIASFLIKVASLIWVVFSEINWKFMISKKAIESSKLEKTSLYDDEIAEYQLIRILDKLEKKNIKVILVFDEIDKIDDSKKMRKVLSDLKHILLLDNSNSIVIAGQKVYYQLLDSNIEDDGLLSSVFTANYHIPMLDKEILRKIVKGYFILEEQNLEKYESYIDSIILNSNQVLRKTKNLIVNNITWENEKPYIIIDKDAIFLYDLDSQILELLYEIDYQHLLSDDDQSLTDLYRNYLFLWIKKMKRFSDTSFIKQDIFDSENIVFVEYPSNSLVRFEFLITVLLEKMLKKKMIIFSKNDDFDDDKVNNIKYVWNKEQLKNDSISTSETKMYTDFFNAFTELDELLGEMSRDLEFDVVENFDLEYLNNYEKIQDYRNRIVHGEILSEENKNEMHKFQNSISRTKGFLYEHYTFTVFKLFAEEKNFKIIKKPTVINPDIQADIQIFNESLDIIVEVKSYKILSVNDQVLKNMFNYLYLSDEYSMKKRESIVVLVVYILEQNKKEGTVIEERFNNIYPEYKGRFFVIVMPFFQKELLLNRLGNILDMIE